MDGNQLLIELVKITDMKIDLMEYVIEKLVEKPKSLQLDFVKTSSVFDKIDWLNMEFLSHYQRFLKLEGIKEMSQIRIELYESLNDLKCLVGYAFELETSLEDILSKL